MIDDRTPHLDLPLPHINNLLQDDVDRLRTAFSTVDSKFQALDALLQSDDATLDQVQELVTAIKENRGDILDLLMGKADQTALDTSVNTLQANINALKFEHEESQLLVEGQTVVDLEVLTSTAGATVFVEGIRIKASEWTPDPVIATRLTLSQPYPAGYEVTVVRRQGGL
jgi:hypothetical protein